MEKSPLKQLAKNWLGALLFPMPLMGLAYLPRYARNWLEYNRRNKSARLGFADSHPCLADWISHTPFDPHYFYQGAWLARRIAQEKPSRHVDIGSSVLAIGVLSGTVETLFVDYRPLHTHLPNLMPVAGNITALPLATDSVASLSCLHVIEHVGLGRYGDPIDPDGSVKAARELQRALKPGGSLYLSVPVGRERICFNAHRVFDPLAVSALLPELALHSFSFVDDAGTFHENQLPGDAHGNDYACGMYIFRK